jgi:predicted nuclease of predicted toxin-antitoxin system
LRKPRYLADIHISPLTCYLLHKAGYQVTRVADILPLTVPDWKVIEYARNHEMIIITQDLDFSALLATTNATKPSIVSLRLSQTEPQAIAKLLIRILPTVEVDLIKGAIVSVTEDKIRVRPLPVH